MTNSTKTVPYYTDAKSIGWEHVDETELDYNDEKPLAVWKALLLPNWRWEAYEKVEESLYFGRVRSPNTFGRWEYRYFSREQLETAGAFRVDTSLDSEEERFPDGGYDLTRVIETEFTALQKSGDGIFGR